MLLTNIRRSLCFLLTLAIFFSLLPCSAFASEDTASVQDNITQSVPESSADEPPSTESTIPTDMLNTVSAEGQNPVQQVVELLDEMLLEYFGKTTMTYEEVCTAVNALSEEDAQKILAFLESGNETVYLTEEESAQLQQTYAGWDTVQLIYELLTPATPTTLAEGTFTPTTGVSVSVTGADSTPTFSEGKLTVTAKGSAGVWGIGAKTATATITITNTKTNNATVSCDWTRTSVNTLTVDDTTQTAENGTAKKENMVPNTDTIVIKITTAKNSTVNKLVLSNFLSEDPAASSKVTFTYDSAVGGITVGGESVTSGTVKELALDGTALVATPSGTAKFLAWVDGNNEVLSKSASYTLQPTRDMTVQALFTSQTTKPYFEVANYIFDHTQLATAFTKGTVAVLAGDGTLPDGNYEIPSGGTLLIPFDSANTLYTTSPGHTGDTYTKPTVYRKLIMSTNAHFTVKSNAAISVSGKHTGHQTQNGAPSGPQGFIEMNDSSSITVEGSGTLYAWGYIIGSGKVIINSGATVYEYFQVTDWRGGDCTITLNEKKDNYQLFPFSQYYIQNVQVPMELKAGATENCFFSVNYTAIGFSGTYIATESAPAPLIGNSGLFRIQSGSVTKDYDEETDRLIFDVDGEITLSNMDIKVKPSMLSITITISSNGYIFPINSNITINVNTGSVVSIDQDISMHPGAVLNIAEGATCNVANGRSIYLYDGDNWGNYVYISGVKFTPIVYAPGQKYTRTDADLVDAKVMVNGTINAGTAHLYTTENGAQIYSTGTGAIVLNDSTANSVIKQIDQGGEGNDEIVTTYEIKVTPAQLMQEDGDYITTAKTGSTETTTYNHDHYTCLDHGDTTTDSTVAKCGTWYAGNHATATSTVLPTYRATGKTAICTCGHGGDVLPKVVQQAAIAASADSEIILDVKFWLPDTVTSVSVVQQCLENKVLKEVEETYTVSNITEESIATGAYREDNGRYVFSRAVASGEMTCPITFTFKDGSGNIVQHRSGEVFSDSLERTVVDYAKLVLDNGSNTQKALINSLAVYGGYSQKYFGKTESGEALFDDAELAHNILGIAAPDDFSSINKDTITQTRIESTNMSELATITQNAFLDSSITLRVFFTTTAGKNLKESKFVLHRPVNGKDAYTENLTPQQVSDTKYYVDITDIPSGYLDHMYKITIDGTYEVKTSVLAYLKSLLQDSTDEDQMNAARAMYLYSEAASNFFDK